MTTTVMRRENAPCSRVKAVLRAKPASATCNSPYRHSLGSATHAREEPGSSHGTIQRVADQIGCGVELLRTWVKPADIDGDVEPGGRPYPPWRRVRGNVAHAAFLHEEGRSSICRLHLYTWM